MRARKALQNIFSNIILQILVAIIGFIIPRLILSVYGSAINGMINSISQFLAYAGLVEMGIGNASIVALYKPLSDRNWTLVSNIVSTAKKNIMYRGYYIRWLFAVLHYYIHLLLIDN